MRYFSTLSVALILLYILLYVYSICMTYIVGSISVVYPYIPDGCSIYPDGDYVDCCDIHDRVYYVGGTLGAKSSADRALWQCVYIA
jgi:hypothetical protein